MSRVELINARSVDPSPFALTCDTCIVGAGAAGIYLGVRLASQGVDVAIIEAGDSVCADAARAGFSFLLEAERYPGAEVGRAFGLGGSTSAWGGLLAPHTERDTRPVESDAFDVWRHVVGVVTERQNKVLAVLGRPRPADFDTFAHQTLGKTARALADAGLATTAGLFLPFRKKNFVQLLNQPLPTGGRLRAVYNAVVSNWSVSSTRTGAQLTSLSTVSENLKQVHITANRFVIAAGAIESARMLLELDASASQPVVRPGAAVGRGLADHLSVAVADVIPASRAHAVRQFAPRFSSGWMRGFRVLEARPPAEAPRAFAHLIFENENPGFALAKEVFRSMQARRLPAVSPRLAVTGLAGFARLGIDRYLRSTLYVSKDTPSHLQLDIEQASVPENRITLSQTKDRHGRQTPSIHWRISERDIRDILQTSQRLLSKWPTASPNVPVLQPRADVCDATKPHDAYHPVGTCRMGRDDGAVVDPSLKVWGLTNLWLVSTAVLPSAGTANPTFTMLCLAEDLVDQMTTVASRKP